MSQGPSTSPHTRPDGTGRTIGIVAARWHAEIVDAMVQGAITELLACGVEQAAVSVYYCPGSYEIPVAAATLARLGTVDAVLCFGVIVRGETAHFEYVSGPVAQGLQNISIETGIPCLFGVLTTDTVEQAQDRAGGKHGNKGTEAAVGALETCKTLDLMRATR